ncbi:hypothetical protein EDB81DRAFT_795005 [Dactylonectria macrodidyma]|uniref:Uncharacterized protein n=1 Tax=Dactylonectria macrodidyma TaxID=307937 RepID=A0A9P9EW55_9HYPO|nr:hypothetical protein EDB81DRAFT_795005 [Dactylonectria macrodidyma]
MERGYPLVALFTLYLTLLFLFRIMVTYAVTRCRLYVGIANSNRIPALDLDFCGVKLICVLEHVLHVSPVIYEKMPSWPCICLVCCLDIQHLPTGPDRSAS